MDLDGKERPIKKSSPPYPTPIGNLIHLPPPNSSRMPVAAGLYLRLSPRASLLSDRAHCQASLLLLLAT